MRFVPCFILVSLGSAALGCSSSTTDTTTIVRPELVQVSPDDFLGALRCGSGDGEVQSYVATLFDISPLLSGVVPDPGSQLPSSAATDCTVPVAFSRVVIGHTYLAQVDGYDRPNTDLEPTAPGARIQLDAKTLQRVSPRWTAKCGGYPQSLVADGGSYVSVGGGPTAADIAADDAGAGGEGNFGVVSYDQITTSPHDCGDGLK